MLIWLRLVFVWAFAVLMTSWFVYTVYGLMSDDTGGRAGIMLAALGNGAVAVWCVRSAVAVTRSKCQGRYPAR